MCGLDRETKKGKREKGKKGKREKSNPPSVLQGRTTVRVDLLTLFELPGSALAVNLTTSG